MPPRQPSKASRMLVRAFVLLGLVLLTGLVVAAIIMGVIGKKGPEPRVISWNQLKDEHKKEITELGILEEHESPRFFYSNALLDMQDSMYLLTNSSVLLYKRDDATPLTRLRFSEIESIETEDHADTTLLTWIVLKLKQPHEKEEVRFTVSTKSHGDRHFSVNIQNMIQRTNRRRSF